MPEKLRALVYLDAFFLENGESLHDALPPFVRHSQVASANETGDGWRVAPITDEFFNVNAADRAWVNAQCTPQSLATFRQRLALRHEFPAAKITHVLATGYEHSPFPPFHERAKARGCQVITVPCGHNVMLDLPDELVRILGAAST